MFSFMGGSCKCQLRVGEFAVCHGAAHLIFFGQSRLSLNPLSFFSLFQAFRTFPNFSEGVTYAS